MTSSNRRRPEAKAKVKNQELLQARKEVIANATPTSSRHQ